MMGWAMAALKGEEWMWRDKTFRVTEACRNGNATREKAMRGDEATNGMGEVRCGEIV